MHVLCLLSLFSGLVYATKDQSYSAPYGSTAIVTIWDDITVTERYTSTVREIYSSCKPSPTVTSTTTTPAWNSVPLATETKTLVPN